MTETVAYRAGLDRLVQLADAVPAGPCRLNGRHAAYLVRRGAADLFAVRSRVGGGVSRRHFIARIPGDGLMPSPTALGAWRLLLVPLPGTQLSGVPADLLHRVGARVDGDGTPVATLTALAVTRALDRALLAVADALRSGQAPREASTLAPRQLSSIGRGAAVTNVSGVWWVRTAGGQIMRNAGGGAEISDLDELLMVAGRDWFTAVSACAVESLSTMDLLVTGQLWAALDKHLARLKRIVETSIEEEEREFRLAIAERKRTNADTVARAARHALGVVGAGGPADAVTGPAQRDLYQRDLCQRAVAVLARLTEADEVVVSEPVDRSRPPADERDAVRSVARSSALHLREVKLPARWWLRDLGPLVGWRPDPMPDPTPEPSPHATRPAGPGPEPGPGTAAPGTAVAGPAAPGPAAAGPGTRPGTGPGPVRAVPLVFRRGRYREVDPETRAERKVSRARAAAFARTATQVQVPLPAATAPRDLLRVGLRGASADVWGLLLSGLVVAVLGLATPLLSGLVFGAIARDGTFTGMAGVSLLFVAGALVAALVGTGQNLRLLRLEGRVEIGAQLAVWDRLIRLPVLFFRRMSSGELANAVLGISFTREALSGLLAQAVPAALTALAVLGLLFSMNLPVALCGLAAVVLTAALLGGCGALVVRRQRRALPAEHHTAALTNQLLGGITKIKLAAAEDRAYARWADDNSAARSALQRVRAVQAALMATATALPIAGQLVLLVLLAGPLRGELTTTEFFVVNVAFMMLLGSLLLLVSAGVEILATLPRLANLGHILHAEPERLSDRVDPGDLRGEIELNQVTFGYNPTDPPVLNEVSLHVRAGEFVAVVGPSGCGKSTLLRLLLGFERPDSGAVLFDGQDLSELDVPAVRRQCGVVLQDGSLFAGTIRENICGTGEFTLDEVWEAAAMAGLDEDVNRLPMGMATMVPFGGGTLSVGQRQRILIARALIHHPRILLFDEATSALDNRTQEAVTASTQKLAASRIIIAHRLSTVRNADTIVVLDRGRVVQRGPYEQLIADRSGLFYRLARRQLLVGPGQPPADADPER